MTGGRVKQDMGWINLSLLRFTYSYCVYRLTTLELYHAMRNIISLAPDPGPRDSAQSAAPPTYMAPGQLRHWP